MMEGAVNGGKNKKIKSKWFPRGHLSVPGDAYPKFSGGNFKKTQQKQSSPGTANPRQLWRAGSPPDISMTFCCVCALCVVAVSCLAAVRQM